MLALRLASSVRIARHAGVKADANPFDPAWDSNGRVIFAKEFPYTDFPPEGIKLYYINNVILLPGEY